MSLFGHFGAYPLLFVLKVLAIISICTVLVLLLVSRFFSFFDDTSYTATFRSHLDSVLDSLVSLMGETRERMAVQNTALKHLPAIVDPICASGAYEPTDLR